MKINVRKLMIKRMERTSAINSFSDTQENKIFFKFLTLLSNLQKSESKNSIDKGWHALLGSSKAK